MITLKAEIILPDKEYILNKRNILSIDQNISDRSDIIMPSWGVISNGGNLRFVDYNGDIKYYAQSGKLNSKIAINIFLQDTLSGHSTDVGKFVSEKWQYDNNNSEVSVSFTDGLTQMQDILITPLEYDLKRATANIEIDSAKYIYDFLQAQTVENGFDMISSSSPDFDKKTLEHLNNIYIAYPYIEETNLWRAWQNFAVAFQLHIYKNRHGKIVCIYHGGD